MRLWDFKILRFLPDSQLLAQKRECDLIWKDIKQGKKTNHILINYIWEYKDFEYRLSLYYKYLANEFFIRNFKFKDNSTHMEVAWEHYHFEYNPFPKHHTFRYFEQCVMNLSEKFDRGQRDFSLDRYEEMIQFYQLYKKSYGECLDIAREVEKERMS